MHLAGICATDLELIRGYKGGFQGVLGHEFVGEVVAAPSAPEWVGRRVVGEINVGCGDCRVCQQGLGKHCRQRTALGIRGRDGVFAEYLALPVANLHAVPESFPTSRPSSSSRWRRRSKFWSRCPSRPATRVVLQGDGRLGLLCAFVLATTGCQLTVIGRHPEKLALAAHRWHPTHGARWDGRGAGPGR